MDIYSANLAARVLLTLMTLGYGLGTVFADFNKTHATNPAWTPHARFHVVWQITSYVGFGLLALALIWLPGPYYLERLYLVCAFGAIIYGAFFIAAATMRLYGGALFDTNGYPPFSLPLLPASRMDVNMTVFSGFSVLLLAAFLAIRPVGGA